jgi:hypothetical protein
MLARIKARIEENNDNFEFFEIPSSPALMCSMKE